MEDRRQSSERLEDETENLEREGQRSEHNLEEHGDKLERDIERTRKDWEQKQDDSSVPGAVPDPEDDE
jgi:hypothetical protein